MTRSPNSLVLPDASAVWRTRPFALCAALLWFEGLLSSARSAPALSLPPALAAAAGLATQLAFTALEASLGTAAWATLGRRVRWSTLALALLTASVPEACAVAVVAGEPALPEAWRVALAGPRGSMFHAPTDALSQAFAAFGLLTVLRLILATRAHAQALREATGGSLAPARRWRDAAFLVLAFYTAARLAIWWGADLLRGRSYHP